MVWTVFYATNIKPVFDQCCHFPVSSRFFQYGIQLFLFIFGFSLGTVPGFYNGSLLVSGFAHGLFLASCITKISQQWVEGDHFDRSALRCDVPVQYFHLYSKDQALLHRSHQSMWRSFLDVHLYTPLIQKQ